MIFIGVDPGITGAIAAIDGNGDVLDVIDMPTMMSGSGKAKVQKRVNATALLDILRTFCPAAENAFVLIEKAQAMRSQGVSSVFSFGHTAGVIEATVACCRFPYELVTAQRWKKHFGLSSDKEQARARAIQLFPGMPLGRKADHNRAESLLIARFGFDTKR